MRMQQPLLWCTERLPHLYGSILNALEQWTLRVLNYKIDPSFESISRVFTEKSRIEVSSKSRSNFKICNILADSKDQKNSYRKHDGVALGTGRQESNLICCHTKEFDFTMLATVGCCHSGAS
eukprot:scaffold25111_cov80-Cyclotella_meneghiniana.AAC.8